MREGCGVGLLKKRKRVSALVQSERRGGSAGEDCPRREAGERDERRRTVTERCEKSAELACSKNGSASVLWCNLNDEGDLLAKIVPGAKQVSGADSETSGDER